MKKSVNESGNATNVSQFKLVIDAVTGFKLEYQPSNPNLSVLNLTHSWTGADDAQGIINSAIQKANPLIHKRALLFDPLNKLITRSLNNLSSTECMQATKDNAKSLANVIRGITKYIPPEEKPVAGAIPADKTDPEGHISTSHGSFVNRVNNLDSFIKLLTEEALYDPAEDDLTVASFTALYVQLKDANNAIGTILTPVKNARIARDIALYTPLTGLYDLQLAVKKYVRGLYGARTAKARMVTSIKFKNRKLK